MKSILKNNDHIASVRHKLNGYGLSIITVYITLLFVYSLGERMSFTKSIWDNLSISFSQILGFRFNFCDLVLLLGIPVVIYVVYLIRRSFLCLDTLFILGYTLILTCTAIFDPDIDTGHNLWMTLYVMMPLFICYYVSRLLDIDGWKHLLFISLRISAYIWGVGCAVSVIQYFTGYADRYPFGIVKNAVTPQGIVGGRLFGCFCDPNYASIICILMILGIIYLIRNHQLHIIGKTLLITCLVLDILYIELAFSRSAFLAIIALLFFFSFLATIKKGSGEFSVLKTILISLVVFILFIAIFVIIYIVITGICRFITGLYLPASAGGLTVRIDLDSGDYSGGRFEIWADYIRAVLDKPLFGFSADGALDYIQRYYPWTEVAGWARAHTHNTYVQILTQGGFIGFIMMFSVVVTPIIRFIKIIFIKKRLEHPGYIYLLFMICITVLVSGIAYSSGFTQIRIEADLLWLALGGLYVYTRTVSTDRPATDEYIS